MTLLVHPATKAQIDVRPQAVATWQRSGWAAPEDLAADGPAASQPPGGGDPGTTEPAGVTDGAPTA